MNQTQAIIFFFFKTKWRTIYRRGGDFLSIYLSIRKIIWAHIYNNQFNFIKAERKIYLYCQFERENYSTRASWSSRDSLFRISFVKPAPTTTQAGLHLLLQLEDMQNPYAPTFSTESRSPARTFLRVRALPSTSPDSQILPQTCTVSCYSDSPQLHSLIPWQDQQRAGRSRWFIPESTPTQLVPWQCFVVATVHIRWPASAIKQRPGSLYSYILNSFSLNSASTFPRTLKKASKLKGDSTGRQGTPMPPPQLRYLNSSPKEARRSLQSESMSSKLWTSFQSVRQLEPMCWCRPTTTIPASLHIRATSLSSPIGIPNFEQGLLVIVLSQWPSPTSVFTRRKTLCPLSSSLQSWSCCLSPRLSTTPSLIASLSSSSRAQLAVWKMRSGGQPQRRQICTYSRETVQQPQTPSERRSLMKQGLVLAFTAQNNLMGSPSVQASIRPTRSLMVSREQRQRGLPQAATSPLMLCPSSSVSAGYSILK